MKNPFVKEDHSSFIAGAIIGSVVAGAAALLLLTDKGADVRGEIAYQFLKLRDRLMGNVPEVVEDHTQDYMQHPMKKPKTDREALQHHEIIHE